ncbi:MAG: molecular chaperone DnaJ, partial [Oscillospiraceae bacterium]|nr:molecular chaperone DnaJ [Oscillospiraceae bacterium]
DNYQNNPLADLAEEKMKEINEAYDAILKQRSGGGQSYSSGGSSYQSGYSRQSQSSADPAMAQARVLIQNGNLNQAEQILRT